MNVIWSEHQMKKNSLYLFLFLCLFLNKNFAANLTLESPDFKLNTMIPTKYTCNGDNISPPLTWQDVPTNTQSLALIVEDPDAPEGVWTHWVLFNIPPALNHLEAGSSIPTGAARGKNSWGDLEYKGPCPPVGAHRYIFKLYALDKTLDLGDGTTNDLVMQAMTSHVLGSSELTGLYQKE